jgi:hypothetical protein
VSPIRPTRATTSGRAYLDLQKLARATGRPTPELHQLYALECLVARIASSPHSGRLVLKGGLLLAAFSARRPTQDIDLAARGLNADTTTVLALLVEIAAMTIDDGVHFVTTEATAEIIREDAIYKAVRVSMPARLASAKLVIQVDVNVGDPIAPEAAHLELPRLLGGSFQALGYPVTMVLAEKLITALERGATNTRWRDFVDVATLSRQQTIVGDDLLVSLHAVASHRRVELVTLAESLDGFAALAEARWMTWRRKHALGDRTPSTFAELLVEVEAFADPALAGQVTGLRWNPSSSAWIPVRS